MGDRYFKHISRNSGNSTIHTALRLCWRLEAEELRIPVTSNPLLLYQNYCPGRMWVQNKPGVRPYWWFLQYSIMHCRIISRPNKLYNASLWHHPKVSSPAIVHTAIGNVQTLHFKQFSLRSHATKVAQNYIWVENDIVVPCSEEYPIFRRIHISAHKSSLNNLDFWGQLLQHNNITSYWMSTNHTCLHMSPFPTMTIPRSSAHGDTRLIVAPDPRVDRGAVVEDGQGAPGHIQSSSEGGSARSAAELVVQLPPRSQGCEVAANVG